MIIKQRLTYWILIVIGTFLFGCSKISLPPDQMDKSTFTGTPCAAPCWHGLMIGKSNESDVLSTLPTLTFIDQNAIFVHRMSMSTFDLSNYAPGAEITARCISNQESCLTLDVVDDILTDIEVVLNYEIKLDEAIGYLGSPDYIGYQLMGAEHVTCEVDLVWGSKQLVLASDAFTGSNIENNCAIVRDKGKTSFNNLLISEARYMSVEAIKFLLSNGRGEFFKYSEMLLEK